MEHPFLFLLESKKAKTAFFFLFYPAFANGGDGDMERNLRAVNFICNCFSNFCAGDIGIPHRLMKGLLLVEVLQVVLLMVLLLLLVVDPPRRGLAGYLKVLVVGYVVQ